MYELWRDHDVNAESSGVGAVRLIMRFSSVVTLSSKNHFQKRRFSTFVYVQAPTLLYFFL